jgi:quinol monooxygenase YgiN
LCEGSPGTHGIRIFKDLGSIRMSFARTVQFSLKSGQVDEFKRVMNTEIFPLLKKEKGFRKALTVLDAHAGTSTTVWDDRPSAETYGAKSYPEMIKKLGPILEGTPTVRMCETVFNLAPETVHA